MEVPIPSYLVLFLKEVVHPFFIFQIFSLMLWYYEEYYAFALIIFIITISSSILNLITIKQNLMKISEMAKYKK